MEHCTARVSGSDPCTIRIAGEVDLDAEPTLRQLVDEVATSCATLRFDMRGVTFCDSSGIHVVLHAYRIGRRVVVQPSPVVLRLLELTGVAELVVIE